jgi:hypothetical protein
MSRLRHLFIVLLLALAASCTEATPPASEDTLVVLYERNPWLMAIGSDSPTFALYADGQVIYRTQPGKYVSLHLDEDQKQTLLAQIGPQALLSLGKSYDSIYLPTDQPTNEMYVWVNGRQKHIQVYGDLRDDKQARSFTPESFLHAFDTIVSYRAEAGPWLPEKLEVLIWPWDYYPDEPSAWPQGWPGYESTQGQIDGEMRRVFIPSSELDELHRLMKEEKPVGLNGRKWSISYRLPFPSEERWKH